MASNVNTPISRVELERRWGAIRTAMTERGIDVLLMHNNNEQAAGYVRYFIDAIATKNGNAVVFEKDGGMTYIRSGASGVDRDLSDNEEESLPGVTRSMSVPSFPGCWYGRDFIAELALKALQPYAGKSIGLVGSSHMFAGFLDAVRRELPKATFVEASDLVDRIMVIKSEEEKDRIRDAAALQDATMRFIFSVIRPGMIERDLQAAAVAFATERGSDFGSYTLGSAQPGTPARRHQAHTQNKVIEKGDVVSILIENSGPGGYFAELGRTCVVGKAAKELTDELEVVLEAQRVRLDLMKPGTSCAEIFERYNEHLRDIGRPEEQRLHCHGQGYYLVERPLVRPEEDMLLEKDMNFACHPTYTFDQMFSWICDNYLIGNDGPGESIHKLPQQIFEV